MVAVSAWTVAKILHKYGNARMWSILKSLYAFVYMYVTFRLYWLYDTITLLRVVRRTARRKVYSTQYERQAGKSRRSVAYFFFIQITRDFSFTRRVSSASPYLRLFPFHFFDSGTDAASESDTEHEFQSDQAKLRRLGKDKVYVKVARA